MAEGKAKKTYEEFAKLPLEERAQMLLRNYFYNECKISGKGVSALSFFPLIEAWAYLERNDYVVFADMIPELKIPYEITHKGLEFMDRWCS